MRLNLALILSTISAVGLVSLAFTVYQISSERSRLNQELKAKMTKITDEIVQNTDFGLMSQINRQCLFDSLMSKYDLLGIVICNDSDTLISSNSIHQIHGDFSTELIAQMIKSKSGQEGVTTLNGREIYMFSRPLQIEALSNSAIIVFCDVGYIEENIGRIWLRNFSRWIIQSCFIAIVILIIIHWGIFYPVNKIVNWIKAARKGNIELLQRHKPAKFLQPLHKEVLQVANAMIEAKAIAEEEAKLRTNAEAIWTEERLRAEVDNLLKGKKMVVVSNREPYMHINEGKEIKYIVPASGMITAMEPILKACGGLWIASGTGSADKETVDLYDKIQVPPEDPKYTLKRLWITKEEEDHFYYGFSNEGLWPLCHIAHTRPIFRKEDWEYYKKVNEDFAKAVLEETAEEEDPFILIQDYHFALLPDLIKREKPKARVAIFWHIPWPNPESFGICPWQKEILLGMLGADIIGFHTQYHCNHFLETVNNALESRVLWENFSVKKGGHTTYVKPFPISIAFTPKDFDNNSTQTKPSLAIKSLGIKAEYFGIGVDRIDYTKGILEKFLSIERFLDKNPSYIEKFTFIQIGAPSRTLIKSYSDLVHKIESEALRINERFKSKKWKAILLLKGHHSHQEILPFYSSANFCMVSSLHDGMNLVAKEFVATRNNNDGVLILSRFAGASNELSGGAISINPYDIEKSADAIKFALEMNREEQYLRMKRMRKMVLSHNIYLWASNVLKSLSTIQN